MADLWDDAVGPLLGYGMIALVLGRAIWLAARR